MPQSNLEPSAVAFGFRFRSICALERVHFLRVAVGWLVIQHQLRQYPRLSRQQPIIAVSLLHAAVHHRCEAHDLLAVVIALAILWIAERNIDALRSPYLGDQRIVRVAERIDEHARLPTMGLSLNFSHFVSPPFISHYNEGKAIWGLAM